MSHLGLHKGSLWIDLILNDAEQSELCSGVQGSAFGVA